MSPEARERSFDELARGLANGSVSRRKALRLMGAALVGGALASIPGAAFGAPQGNSACDAFCHENFSGRDAGTCTRQGARGTGPCYSCTAVAGCGPNFSPSCTGGQTYNCSSCTCAALCPAPPACTATCPCVSGQTCVNGNCCPTSRACGTTCCDACSTCQDGTCVSSCAAGQDCLSNGTCVTTCPSGGSLECPGLCICLGRTCGAGVTVSNRCETHADCATGQFCSPNFTGGPFCTAACTA
jgi:hypothetical protein